MQNINQSDDIFIACIKVNQSVKYGIVNKVMVQCYSIYGN
jgi:hypothetical protein